MLSPKLGVVRGDQKFMNFKGAFSSINERKDNNHAFWELTYKF